MRRYRALKRASNNSYVLLDYEIGETILVGETKYNEILESHDIDAPENGGMVWSDGVAFREGMTYSEQVLGYCDFGITEEIRKVKMTQYGVVVDTESRDNEYLNGRWIDNKILESIRKTNAMWKFTGAPIELRMDTLSGIFGIRVSKYDAEVAIAVKVPDMTLEIESRVARENCSGIVLGVEMNKACKKLGAGAFNGITIHNIDLSNIEIIEEVAMGNVRLETDIDLKMCEEIHRGAFWGASIKNIKVYKIKELGDRAFYDCEANKIEIEDIDKAGESVFGETIANYVQILSLGEMRDGLARKANIKCMHIEKVRVVGGYAFEKAKIGGLSINCSEIETSAFIDSEIGQIDITCGCRIRRAAFYGAKIRVLNINGNFEMDTKAFRTTLIGKLNINGIEVKQLEGVTITG